MPKPELEFFDPSEIPSQGVGGIQGLSEQILSLDETSGDYTRLLRFEPGTDTTPMGPLTHDFWEEVWIIEGSIYDITLQREFTAGMYACRPPGMPHGPWRSPNGCRTVEFRRYERE
ncbi:MAG: cupin domain-containing protein [Chloroflexi bacterium]|nr:cupin domain-containing protein [Chloroflexota bacterium]